jgi:hypothetical protein
MLVSVTPCCVLPVALPGPHGEARVPNVCVEELEELLELVPDVDDDVLFDDDDVGRLLLHAVARSTADTTSASAPNFAVLLFVTKSTPCYRRGPSRRPSPTP